jgi:hypothetical protein
MSGLPSPPDLEARVSALETLNRRLVAAVLGMGVLLFVLFALALVARAEATADCDTPAVESATTVAAVVVSCDGASVH